MKTPLARTGIKPYKSEWDGSIYMMFFPMFIFGACLVFPDLWCANNTTVIIIIIIIAIIVIIIIIIIIIIIFIIIIIIIINIISLVCKT